ncbi:MAG TPA: class I SAM-dependent methyltransferase [Vicinamibacterales bacterium]
MTRERPDALAHLRFKAEADRFRGLGLEEAFTRIYRTNLWGSEASRSGLGSQLDATQRLREAIPALLRRLEARSLLDAPCGDFAWMSQVVLGDIAYTGADIVPDLIARLRAEHGGPLRRFLHLDITRDPLPAADVVLCRDLLVHLSFANIRRVLENVVRSGARYFLTTTFTDHLVNEDIQDGDWRLLNLERPPVSLPPPLELLVEGCEEGGGGFSDKSLGLWSVDQLRTSTLADFS